MQLGRHVAPEGESKPYTLRWPPLEAAEQSSALILCGLLLMLAWYRDFSPCRLGFLCTVPGRWPLWISSVCAIEQPAIVGNSESWKKLQVFFQ